jgi:hypothetical protein
MVNKIFNFLNPFKKGDDIPQVTIPSCYNLPSSVIPHWVSCDIKSQVKSMVESNTKLYEMVKKHGKVVVNFQTEWDEKKKVSLTNYRHFLRHRTMYLHLLDGEFFNLDSDSDKMQWKRHQLLNQIL